MSTIAQLWVALGLDKSGYDKGLGDAESQAKRSASSITSGLSKIGGAVVTGGIAAVSAGIAGMSAVIASSIGPASDLAETANKINVVFGDAAAEVNQFAENAATALGQTKQQALDAAATFGVFGKAAGLSGSDLGDFSTTLTGLSSDLASFYNTSPEEAIDAIGAALRGEAEPMRRYGVLLDDATMRQEALKMGLISSTSEALTPAQKVMAAYQLILNQTADAQGDFARTSDGLANQQRIAAAQFENLRTQIGTAFLPTVQRMAQMLNEILGNPAIQAAITNITNGIAGFAASVVEKLPLVIEWFQKAFGWLKENEGVIVGVLAALGVAVAAFVYTTVIPAAISVITAMAPIIAVMALVAGAAYLIYEAWTNDWGGIRTTITTWWEETGRPIFDLIVQWLQVNIPKALQTLREWWDSTVAFVQEVLAKLRTAWEGDFLGIRTAVEGAWTYLSEIFAAFRAAFEGDWYAFGEHLRAAWDALWETVKGVLSKAWDDLQLIVADIAQSIVDWFRDTDWKQVGIDVVTGIANGMLATISAVSEAAKTVGKNALDAWNGFWDSHSPSRVAEKSAMPVGQGWGLGIMKSIAGVVDMLPGEIAPMVPALASIGEEVGPAGGGGLRANAGAGNVVNVYITGPLMGFADEYDLALKLKNILQEQIPAWASLLM